MELKNENKFNTDGWIVTDLDDNKIYKIKPEYHMTIDLCRSYHGQWFCDNNHPIYNVEYSSNLNSIINNSWINISKNNIFRCYWENNKWIAKDPRNDKIRANSLKLVEEITKIS